MVRFVLVSVESVRLAAALCRKILSMAYSLVTGATAGIGNAFARRLAADGHNLVLVARDEVRLRSVARDLESQFSVQVDVLVADLSTRDGVERVSTWIKDSAETISVLVNNAGFGIKSTFLDSDLQTQEDQLHVLCTAVLVLSHAAGRRMRDSAAGVIINVSSVASFTALGTYAAAKSWVTTFSEAIDRELFGTGVRVMALCPGFVRTEFHERAKLHMNRLPQWAWLDADKLVDTALADLRKGVVVSVPDVKYKTLVAAATYLPRPLVRGLSGRVRKERDQ